MKKTTIQLTSEQQKQIKDATGKSITTLSIDLPLSSNLNDEELKQVSGGGKASLSDFSISKAVDKSSPTL